VTSRAGSLAAGHTQFLRIPPFPRASVDSIAVTLTGCVGIKSPSALAQALASARVGGAFWAAQPDPQIGRDLLLAPSTREEARLMLAQAAVDGMAERVHLLEPAREVDPWHIADHAAAIWVGADHELALVGALAGKPLKLFGNGRFSALGEGTPAPEILHRLLAEELTGRTAYTNPFTGKPMDALAAIVMLAEWRRLIDSNRRISAVYGIARWKRATVDALLWAGEGPPAYARKAKALAHGDTALVWKSRAPAHLPGQLESQGVVVGEIEDGFIRSTGLGANCVPPLSVVVDHLGIYFDPSQSSSRMPRFPMNWSNGPLPFVNIWFRQASANMAAQTCGWNARRDYAGRSWSQDKSKMIVR
jgi:capsular polysaccharide export protein